MSGPIKRKMWALTSNGKVPRTTAWRMRSARESVDKLVCEEGSIPFNYDEVEALRNDYHADSTEDSNDDERDGDNRDDDDEMVEDDTDDDNKDDDNSDVDTDNDSSNNDDTDDESHTGESEASTGSFGDDSLPLYPGSSMSKLTALLAVMLFAVRHKLSGSALAVELISVLLRDGHQFVSTAYWPRYYFKTIYQEPDPKLHAYCDQFLGRIRKNEPASLKGAA